MKIHPVGREYFHADRWTDMRKLVFAFRPKFANALLKKWGGGGVTKRTKSNIYAIEVST